MRELELAVVGGGPCGIATGLAAQAAGLDYRIVEQGDWMQALRVFPPEMTFFSTAEKLEVGGVPFLPAGTRPTCGQVIEYYAGIARRVGLRAWLGHRLTSVHRVGPHRFRLTLTPARPVAADVKPWSESSPPPDPAEIVEAENLVLATGYLDRPNLLGVPGEDLPFVTHYYSSGESFAGKSVLVVGGRNSAVEACLNLLEHGAQVTLVHRGPSLSDKVKPWLRPSIDLALQAGAITPFWNTTIAAIRARTPDVRLGQAARPGRVELNTPGGPRTLEVDAVLAMTGYRPDHRLLVALGVPIDPLTGIPSHDPETLETPVPGLYVAGVLSAGFDANVIFIENGRFHGERIVASILSRAR